MTHYAVDVATVNEDGGEYSTEREREREGWNDGQEKIFKDEGEKEMYIHLHK